MGNSRVGREGLLVKEGETGEGAISILVPEPAGMELGFPSGDLTGGRSPFFR